MSNNADGRCRICEKKTRFPARELVSVSIDTDEVLVCYACRKEFIEGLRFLFNGLRKLKGNSPYRFTSRLGVPR